MAGLPGAFSDCVYEASLPTTMFAFVGRFRWKQIDNLKLTGKLRNQSRYQLDAGIFPTTITLKSWSQYNYPYQHPYLMHLGWV